MASTIPSDLRTAIERLLPELPILLGQDSAVFLAKLDGFLEKGDETQILDLFGDYPKVHERLADLLDEQGREAEEMKGGLNPFVCLFAPQQYRCKVGPHFVSSQDVERDAVGDPFCPIHHIRVSGLSDEGNK